MADVQEIVVPEGQQDTPLNVTLPTDLDGDPLTVTITEVPTVGTVTKPDGTPVKPGDVLTPQELSELLYDAPDEDPGTDPGDLTYNVSDGTDTVPGSVNIVINDAPSALDNSAATDPGQPVTFSITNNDSDPDGEVDPATVNLDRVPPGEDKTLTVPGEGTYSVDEAGNITFTPEAGFAGETTPVPYTVKDNDGLLSNPANITVNVEAGANNPPTTDVQEVVVPEGQQDAPLNVTLPTDLDGDPLTVTITEVPTLGTVTKPDGTPVQPGDVLTPEELSSLLYDAPGEDPGTDPGDLGYTVSDGTDTVPGSVNIVINEAPSALDDSAATDPGQPITFSITNNDNDPDGVIDLTTVDLDPSTPGEDKTLTVAGEGTYSVDEAGNVTFTPEAGFAGETTPVPYTVKDNDGLVSNPANITVLVEEGANNPPTSDIQEIVVPEGQEDTPLNVTLPTDLDGDPLTVTITEVPTLGTITKPDGTPVQPGDVLTPEELSSLLYDAPAEDPGTDPGDLSYLVSDGTDTVPGSVNIVINDAPNALDNSAATDPGQPITFSITNNDSDPDGVIDLTTVDLEPSTPGEDKTLTVAGEGTYSVDAAGNVTFTPEAGFEGETTPVPYTVKDNDGLVSNQANITVTVEEGANNPPTVSNKEIVVPEGQQDTPLNVTLPTDLDGDPLTVTITEVPTVGTITKPDGTPVQPGDVLTPEELSSLLYDAPAEDPGTDPGDLSYTVSDGTDTVPGSVNIVINEAPTAEDDRAATDPGQPITFSIANNDSDPDGVVDLTTVDLDPSTPGEQKTLTVPGEGTYNVDAAGNVTFTPEAGFAGETTPVPYTVKDNNGLVSNPANITVLVEEGANNPPTVTDKEIVVPEGEQDTPLGVKLPTDLDGDPLTVTITEVPTVGTVTKPDGTPVQPGDVLTPEELSSLLYDAPGEDPGTDPGDLVYEVSDGTDTVTGTVDIAINEPPTAIDDSAVTDPGTPVTFKVTANDSDPDSILNLSTVDLDPSTPGEQKTLTSTR